MNLFETVFNRLPHHSDHRSEKPDKPLLAEPVVTSPSVDCRKWYTHEQQPIVSKSKIEKDDISKELTLKIYTHLTVKSYDDIKQLIEAVHAGESVDTTPYYSVRIFDVLRLITPESIVVIATIHENEIEKPIGYAMLNQSKNSSLESREIGVMVSSQARNLGIAHKMFQEVLTNAQKLGVKNCIAYFMTGNRPVWRLLNEAERLELITFTTERDGPETTAKISIGQKTHEVINELGQSPQSQIEMLRPAE